VPCPPTLTAIIRWHIGEFGLGPGGRLFVGERNKEELPILTINRIWRQARQAAFTPEVYASPLAETPYDLRHAFDSTNLNAGISPAQVAEWGRPVSRGDVAHLRRVPRRGTGGATPPDEAGFGGRSAAPGIAVLTTLVGVGVTAVYGWATGLAAPDKPEISVSDSSATLTDLSYVYEEQILETPATLPPGGVKAGSIRLKLLVQNSTGASIRILDLQARVTAQSAPLGGTLIARVPQGSANEVIGSACGRIRRSRGFSPRARSATRSSPFSRSRSRTGRARSSR
jgi:hypothetical protein